MGIDSTYSLPRVGWRGARWSRAAFGYLALTGLVGAGALLALAAAARPGFLVPVDRLPLPDWLAGPLAGSSAALSSHGFVVLLGFMVACYAVALACRRGLAPRIVGAVIVALFAIFVLAPPLLSTDLFSYIAYGRMGALHDINPYAHGPAAIATDPVYPFTHWRKAISVYGPLFTLLSYAVAPLGVAGALWSFKALAGLAGLGLVGLVWAGTRRRGLESLGPAMLVGLNPVLLVYAVGGGHNDVLMLAIALAGVHLVLVGARGSAGAALVAAAAIKLSTAVVAPFALLGARAGERRALVAGALGALAVVSAAAVVAFGTQALAFAVQLERQQSGRVSGSSWPTTLTSLLGSGADVRAIARLALLAALGYLLWRTWRGTLDWVAGAGWALLALVVTSPWLLAWYTAWPLPFAALTRDRRLVAATLFAQALFLAHLIRLAG